MMAGFLLFTAAFAQAQLRTTYATAERLAAASGLVVLGTVSEVVTAAQKEERRQKFKWFAGGAGALAGCFVLLLGIEFAQRAMMA